MKKKSLPGLAMTGGLEVVMTQRAGVEVSIEGMRQIHLTSREDKVLPLQRSSKGLSPGQSHIPSS